MLFDQWEKDEEPIPVDELQIGDPNRPPPEIDFSKINPDEPDALLKVIFFQKICWHLSDPLTLMQNRSFGSFFI